MGLCWVTKKWNIVVIGQFAFKVFQLAREFQADTFPDKVSLGVGAYRWGYLSGNYDYEDVYILSHRKPEKAQQQDIGFEKVKMALQCSMNKGFFWAN